MKFCEFTRPAPRGFWGLEIKMEKVMEIGKLEWFVYANRRFLSAGVSFMLYILGFVCLKLAFPEEFIVVLFTYGILGTVAGVAMYEMLRDLIKKQTNMKLGFAGEEKEKERVQKMKEEQERATAQHLKEKREVDVELLKEKLRILKDAKGVVCIIYPSKKEGVPHHNNEH